MPLVLGIDSSIRSTKAVVCDAEDGRIVATAESPHPAATPPRSEQEPTAWWDAMVAAIAATGIRDIGAMSVAAQPHGLVALDTAGSPLRAAKLWNDTQAAPEAAAMVEQFGAEWWSSRCGVVPVAALTISKLAWLYRHNRAAARKLATILVPHDYLTYRLTGRFVTDRGDASGTGYWSPFQEKWRADILDAVVDSVGAAVWHERLPAVLAAGEPADWMSASVYETIGLKGRPLIGPGTGSVMASALGVGLGEEQIGIALGADGAVYARTSYPVADAEGGVASLADATGGFLPAVTTLNAMHVTDAVARLLGVDAAALDDLALAAPPGAGGVVVLPFFDGERAPNRPDATGIVTGLRPHSEREHLARAAFEGVVCNLLNGLDAVQATAAGLDTERVVLVGAGAQSRAYQQIVADLTGMPVLVPAGREPVAVGAAVQAAAVLLEEAPDDVAAAWELGLGDEVEPDESVDRHAVRAQFDRATRRP